MEDMKNTILWNQAKVSLWLMPPEPAYSEIASQITKLAQREGSSVAFEPHVTIVGGISIQSPEEVGEIAEKLQEGLKGFGEVAVNVLPEAEGYDDKWNQALFLPIDPTDKLLHLCRKSREILELDAVTSLFPPPVNRPHISLYYGLENIPGRDEVTSVPSFESNRLTLWKTDPATVEGVRCWEKLAVIDIA